MIAECLSRPPSRTSRTAVPTVCAPATASLGLCFYEKGSRRVTPAGHTQSANPIFMPRARARQIPHLNPTQDPPVPHPTPAQIWLQAPAAARSRKADRPHVATQPVLYQGLPERRGIMWLHNLRHIGVSYSREE